MDTNLSLKTCRICSMKTDSKSGIPLFGERALKLFLQEKIKKYLSLTVSARDKLPKMICLDCCTRIDGFHRFATMALQNQEKMTKFLDSFNPKSNQTEDDEKTEIKSLLHSYLTKEVKDTSSPVEIEPVAMTATAPTEDQTTEVTEVEVRVDPMMILQLGMDDDEYTSDTESENNKTDHSDSISNGDASADRLSEVEPHSNAYQKPYQCVACPKSFTSEFALKNHWWTHTSRKKKAVNLYNDRFYRTHDHNYIEQVDNSDKSSGSEKEEDIGCDEFACPVCGKSMSSRANLQVHLEAHRPKGRFACDICGRIFKTSCNLYRHKEYHGGVQYPCNICGRVYPTNSTLRAHSITHSDLRPHKCPLCDKTFKRNQDLKFHINQHTGARPYQCPYCPKAFASSGNCFSHRKRMHPIEVERDRERAAKIM